MAVAFAFEGAIVKQEIHHATVSKGTGHLCDDRAQFLFGQMKPRGTGPDSVVLFARGELIKEHLVRVHAATL